MAFYSLFADILDYPVHPIAQILNACAAPREPECPEARALLVSFHNAIEGMSLGQLQESYINAFDFRPDCTPNLGYHLFGDDGRRGLFLAELKGRMESAGVTLGSELPDHISLVLRYMEQHEQERSTLIEDCMLPAVSRMAEALDSSENPYKHALRALHSVLQHQSETPSESAQAMKV